MQTAKKQKDDLEETAPTTTRGAIGRSPVDKIIEEYKKEALRRDTTPKATLYKYINPTGADRIFAGYFTGDEIPNRHQIGLTYGSGKYFLELDQPKGKAEEEEGTSLIFSIHEIYDQLKAKADAEAQRKAYGTAGDPGAAAGMVMQQQQPNQSFQMVKEILGLIIPVIKAANQPGTAAAANRGESAQEMFSSYAMMQKMLKANLFDTAQTYREFNKRFTEYEEQDTNGIDTGTPEEKQGGLLEKIISLIEPFFGLISQKTPAAQFAATTLKAAPQFLEVLNDPTLCRHIVNHFDRTKGRAAADIALKNIGINRARLFAAETPAPQTTLKRIQGRPAAATDSTGKSTTTGRAAA